MRGLDRLRRIHAGVHAQRAALAEIHAVPAAWSGRFVVVVARVAQATLVRSPFTDVECAALRVRCFRSSWGGERSSWPVVDDTLLGGDALVIDDHGLVAEVPLGGADLEGDARDVSERAGLDARQPALRYLHARGLPVGCRVVENCLHLGDVVAIAGVVDPAPAEGGGYRSPPRSRVRLVAGEGPAVRIAPPSPRP